MSSTFHVNTDEISNDFIEKIKSRHPHKDVEIIINERTEEFPRMNWEKSFGANEQSEDELHFTSIVNEADDTEWTW